MCRTKLKALLPSIWRRFLRETFAGPEEAAAVFGVSRSTAYLWWSGDSVPGGDAVLAAYQSHGPQLSAAVREEGRR